MTRISDDEKVELLRLAASSSMRDDMELIGSQRHNPLIVDGEIDMDRVIEFVTQFNEFINHKQRPFEPMIEREMKL